MLDATKQEERDLMILRLSNRSKILQEELKEISKTLQRLNLLRQDAPKDQFGDDIPQVEMDKHFTKAKAEYSKCFANSKPATP